MLKNVEIVHYECIQYDMTPDEFLQNVVIKQLEKYTPRMLEFAKKHSEQECFDEAEDWWEDFKICVTTEKALKKIIAEHFRKQKEVAYT